MTTAAYKLTPLYVGRCTLGRDHVLGEEYSPDDRMEFALYAFLADGGPGRRALIDLGPVGLRYLNDMFRRYRFFRDLPGDPDAIVQPAGNVFDALQRLGLRPDDIDQVVLTHLHADHHGLTDGTDAGGVLRLPNARVHVSRIGWRHNLNARKGGTWSSYVDFAFSDYLFEQEKAGRVLFHDDGEVIPGIDVIYLGGHAPCSQAVRVRTHHGPAVVASDEIYHYELLEHAVIARLRTSVKRFIAANEKLVELAFNHAVLLPCHEPLLAQAYEREGDNWLQAVKPLSDRAARGFRESSKRVVGREPARTAPAP